MVEGRLPRWSSGKETPASARDRGLIPGGKDPLEKEMATHSNILAWKIPQTRGAWWATVHGSQRVGHDWVTEHTGMIVHPVHQWTHVVPVSWLL